MQDILKKYKKHRLLSNIWVVALSLIMAVWINFFVIDSTNFGQNLKTSVLNSSTNNNLADIYLENLNNEIKLKTSKDINNLKSLSFSISYNPNNLKIEEFISSNAQILNLSNTPWINSVTITFDNIVDIKWWENITSIKTSKKDNKIENINIVDANFTDWEAEVYLLTTSWISF